MSDVQKEEDNSRKQAFSIFSGCQHKSLNVHGNLHLKRLDRMDIETLVAVPAEETSPAGPA